MIEIDGSQGEGGGQVLRTSLALAALLGEPLRIFNIRHNRPNPGLARQHLASVRAIQEITRGRAEGARISSTELQFSPREIKPGRYRINIGSAGSITLVLQTLLPVCLFAPGQVELVITGGTDVKWSPPIDYLRQVFLPVMQKTGVKGEIELRRRGYYPRGEGIVKITTAPVESLRALNLPERGGVKEVKGIAHSYNLPRHIVEREAAAARERLNHPCDIKLECGRGFSTGTGIVLWAVCENSILGSSALGEVGKKAEKVGEEAAARLLEELRGRASLDSHLGDQVIPYLALAEGRSLVRVSRITPHLTTNIHVVEEILGLRFQVKEKEGVICVKGVGLRNEAL